MSAWQPRVSVVVPVRDRAGVIGACVDSILASDYPTGRLELVVADNASSDGTAEVLRGYGARIKTVYEPTRGPAAARNAGLRAASGDVVAFTDSDCVVDRAWVSHLVAPLADAGVGAVGGRILALPGGNNLEHFGERIHDHAKAIYRFRPAYLITMNVAARRDVLAALGGFDERLLRCEDVDLAYRMTQAGHAFAYAPDAVVYHRNRSTLPELLAEGYAHGFYSARLDRLHGAYRRATAGLNRRDARAETAYSRALASGEETLYWFLFRSAKRVGRFMGSLESFLSREA